MSYLYPTNFPPTQPPGTCSTCCGPVSMGVNSIYAGTDVVASPGVTLSLGQLRFSLDLMSVAALGRCGSWRFALNYLSGAGISTLTGLGFNFTQNPVLTLDGSSNATITSAENTQEVFAYNASDGSYSSQNNNTASNLVLDGTSGNFILTSAWGEVAVYSAMDSISPGQLLSVTDRYGNGQTFTWVVTASVVQLQSATDSYGRTVQYTYFGSEFRYLLQQIVDYQGRQLNFQYDSSGRLQAVILPSVNLAAAGNTFPSGKAYVFQYDTTNSRTQRQNDLIKIWHPNQTLAFMGSDPNSVDVASVYGTPSRYSIAYGQDPTDTDLWGRVISVTAGGDGVGGTSSFFYNSNPMDLPLNVVDPLDYIVFQAVVTDRNGNQTVYNFNEQQMPAMVQQMPTRSKLLVTPPLETTSWITWTVFNKHNQATAIVYPEGNSVTYTYEDGTGTGITAGFWAPRVGLMSSMTRLPGNTFGITANRNASAGLQTVQTTTYFYEPMFSQLCATVEPRGNPYDGSSYFSPQNGGTASPGRYATYTTLDYQKNQLSTVDTYFAPLLGLSTGDIDTLISYVANQMTTAGFTTGEAFAVSLGDINGDGTGDGTAGPGPTQTITAPMFGNIVMVQQPSVTPVGASSPTQVRQQLYTSNNSGQPTTMTDAEGNVTAYLRYPTSDPNGGGDLTPGFFANDPIGAQQYGMLREVHVDIDPNDVMSLIGFAGDLVAFTSPRPITRTNTSSPLFYQDLVTRYEGSGQAGGCSSCAYDELGNPTAVTDARGFTTITQRNEIGQVYRTIAPQPYGFTTEMYYDADGNVTRVDTQDLQPAYTSGDPTSPGYGQITPTGSGYVAGGGAVGTGAPDYTATAHVPMQPGPGGSVRPGWFTNLYQYNILDWKIQDDIDATGSNPANLITTYAYDPNGNLITITKPQGNTVQYDYDERNLKIAQLVGSDPSYGGGSLTVWYYDNNGMLNSVVGPDSEYRGGAIYADCWLTVIIADAFGGSSSLTQTGDWLVQNFYDGFDRVYQTIDALGNVAASTFDPSGRVVEADFYGPVTGTPTDRTGSTNTLLSTTLVRFDEAGRTFEQQRNVFIPAGISLPSGRSVTQSGGGLTANSPYNTHTGTVTLTTSNTSSYVLSRMVYDRADRMIVSIADNTAPTTTAYDGAGRAITVTDPLGNIMSYAYDGNGNVVQTLSTELFVYNVSMGHITTETFTSVTFHDCLGQTTATATQGADGFFTPALSSATNYSSPASTLFSLSGYDSRGNAVVGVDPNGNSVIMEYDGASRRIETDQLQRITGLGWQSPAGNQSFLSGGRGLVRTQSVYDGNGNLLTLIDDKGNETSYTYDLLDRQVTMTFQDGSTRSYFYNLSGDLLAYDDENGSTQNNTFDPLGRRIENYIDPVAAGVTGTSQQNFSYDGLGRMTYAYDHHLPVTSPVPTRTYSNFYYDSLGRMIEGTQSTTSASTPVASTTHSQFFSLVVQQLTYPSGRQTSNSYDLLYRRTNVSESGGSSIASWTFAGPGRVAQVALGNGLDCSFTNNAGSSTAVQYNVSNPAWSSGDNLGYDGVGRNIAKRYMNASSGLVVGFSTAYDRAGNKTYERHLHAPSRSHLYRPIDASGNVGVGYDSLNRLLQYQRGTLATNGGLYNTGGGSITSPIALPGTDASRSYNLDGLGNWKNTGYIPIESNGSEGSLVTEIRQHNSTNQLVQFGTTPVAYDHGNNPGNGPLISVQGNGNIANDGTRVYQYDALNRLSQVNSSGGSVLAVYRYDALNRRVIKAVSNGGVTGDSPDVITTYLYDGDQCIEEQNYTGSAFAVARQFVWGIYIDELMQMTTYTTLGAQSLPAGSYYLLSDLLYRSVALTNASGGIVEAYDTDAYGNTLIFSAPDGSSNWFGDGAVQSVQPACTTIFTGRQYDAEAENYYYRARYYEPPLGRFTGRDPIIYGDGLNLFEYGSSRATIRVDPTGHDSSGGNAHCSALLQGINDARQKLAAAKQQFIFNNGSLRDVDAAMGILFLSILVYNQNCGAHLPLPASPSTGSTSKPPPPATPSRSKSGACWPWSCYFCGCMDLAGMPYPSNWYTGSMSVLGSVNTLLVFIAKYGSKVTVGELVGAGFAADFASALLAAGASLWAGYAAGCAARASGEKLADELFGCCVVNTSCSGFNYMQESSW